MISGYLIGSILLTEFEQGKFSIITFYERRARRILPVLFFVMACTVIPACYILMPLDLEDFFQSVIAVSVFSSNILFWAESDYFATAAELKPLLHTWSLAVEEQYYIFFPLLLMLTWRFGKTKLIAILAMLFFLSLALAHWAAFNKPSANFYLLPSRGWELLIGVFAAFYLLHAEPEKMPHKAQQTLSFIGLMMVIAAVVLFDHHTPFPSLYTLLPTVGTLLIILAAHKGTWVYGLLSQRLLVGIGLISYSAYLWHQPIFALVKYSHFSQPSLWLMTSLVLGCLILSYFSWRFIEMPFRDRGRFKRQFIFKSSFMGTMLFIIASTGVLSLGVQQILPDRQQIVLGGYRAENRQLQVESWNLLRQRTADDQYGVLNNEYDNQLWFDEFDQRRRVLLVGNSHSKDLYNVLDASQTAKQAFQLARFGVELGEIDQQLFQSENYLSADIVIFVSQFKPQDMTHLPVVIAQAIADEKLTVVVRNIYEFEVFGSRTYADFLLNVLANDKPVTQIDKSDVDEINRKHYLQLKQRPVSMLIQQSNELITKLASQYSQLVVLDRMEYICESFMQRCFVLNTNYQKYFYDYGHHTEVGAKFFGDRVDSVRWLSPLMSALD
ncbi:acyltransferase family protein [Shewanella waksmanii]|uniref:acyltransferase family protein n=1 Tax=Shewanella waksmanii TaxID=213783 RepID=UPI0037368C60